MQKERVWYLDYLRIAATIAVVILHVSSQNWYAVKIETFEWKVFSTVDSLVRWCVPMFVMISGALFLDNSKTLSVKTLYTKYIFRLITAFVFWSAIYVADDIIYGTEWKKVLKTFVTGQNYMWFIFMMAGLYMITPFLRKITESKQLTEYFLLLAFIVTVFLPRITAVCRTFHIPYTNLLLECYEEIKKDTELHFVLGYAGYYVLGWYLSKVEIKQLLRKMCYVAGAAGLVSTVILTDWHSGLRGTQSTFFYSYFSIGVMCAAVGIFLFARYELTRFIPNKRQKVLVLKASAYSFGVYLVHILVLNNIRSIFGISTLSGNPIVSVLLLGIAVLVISFIISGILHMIPGLRKYVV